MFIRPIDDDEVFEMLKKLDKSKSSGPNSIPTNLLKDHAAAFVLPLKQLSTSPLSRESSLIY